MARQGFFQLGPLASSQASEVKPRKPLQTGTGCDACLRYETCAAPKLGHVGEGRKQILVVVEVPTHRDAEQGKLLSGDSRSVLADMLDTADLSLKDCWVVPAVRCETEDDVDNAAVTHCRPLLMNTIKELKPKVIVLMGIQSIQSVLGPKLTSRLSSVQPSATIGFCIPDRELNAWLICTNSLQHMVGADRKRDLKLIYSRQFASAARCLDRPFPIVPDSVECTMHVDRATEILREVISTAKEIAFDYETTGLKPQAKGHRIVTTAVAWRLADGTAHAASFPFFSDLVFRALWRKLLINESVGKIAHNNSFEDTWTHWRAGGDGIPKYWVKGWTGDTCLQAHCLNNRAPTGLKWEVAWRFGVFGYDVMVDPYIKSPKKDGANGFNRMGQMAPSMILPYNALDALYSLVIDGQQKKELDDFQRQGSDFFVESISHLAYASSAGIPLDPERVTQTHRELSLQLDSDESSLKAMPEYSMIPGFNPGSNPQLTTLLYDKLGYAPHPELGRAVDEEALEAIGTPFVSKLLEIRQLKKLRDTYIEGFLRESVNGVLHTFFHLNKVDTFRGSSSDPNFQNIPKRNKAAQKATRSCFRPSPGNRLVEYDYKAVEVGIGCCYHFDPVMIKYIEDPTKDMHRDTTFGLFFRTHEDFTKDERHLSKNGFVFPSFYGSVGQNMAHGLWAEMPDYTKIHLMSNGVMNFADFQEHVLAYEKEFWEVRFQAYGEWRNKIWREYQKTGYIELLTGFRMYGPLKRTQATNGQIQGTAFHCLLRTMGKTGPKIEALSGRSRIVGQIHDAIVADIHPEDEPEVDKLVKYYGTQEIREAWSWINVPLTIEKDRSEIDGTWAQMTSCGAL